MIETGLLRIQAAQTPRLPTTATRPVGSDPDSAVRSDAISSLGESEQVADRSRTARRDALAQELQRLIAMARKLNGVGELRSNADALQDIARTIAKVSRALAEAERSLPPAARRGIPATGIAATSSPPAAGQPAPEPAAAQPDGAPEGSARSGTAVLLRDAVGILERMRDTVDAAARLERLLDPEAAEEREKARREVNGYAVELRGLAGSLELPRATTSIDLQI